MARASRNSVGRLLLWSAAALLGGFGCRQVIGIEEAELDPDRASGRSGAASSDVEAPLSEGGMAGAAESRGGQSSLAQGGEDSASASGGDGEPGGAGGAAGGAPAEQSLCERYCSAVGASCQGDFAVYTSHDTCLAVCALLPAGQPGDRNVNSVECRLHAALIAPSEVPHYCPIAGPGGSGECGSTCEGYCTLMGAICDQWSDLESAQCLSNCAKLPDSGGYTTALSGHYYSGNHVQCRLYHVCAALADDAEQHCLHASGAAPCK